MQSSAINLRDQDACSSLLLPGNPNNSNYSCLIVTEVPAETGRFAGRPFYNNPEY